MMWLAGISSAAFVFAIRVVFWWHSTLDVRVALAGVYFLIGTVFLPCTISSNRSSGSP